MNLFHLSHLLLTLSILELIPVESLDSNSPPVITRDGWASTDDFMSWNTNLTGMPLGNGNASVFVVGPSVRGLSLLCNATYPIEWTFHREKWGRRTSWATTLVSTRESDPQTLAPLWYTLELRVLGSNVEITGNYTCQKYGRPDKSSSVYIYWEGSSPPYLTLLRSGRDRRKILFDPKGRSFKLPCTVSRPDVTVKLTKTTKENKTSTLDVSESVKYNPAVGFTIFYPDAEPSGLYICSVGDADDDDFLEFEVTPGDDPPKPEFEDLIFKDADFHYNASKHQFVCCSSSSKPPKVALKYCSHPVTCQLTKHVLHKIESAGRKSTKDNCSFMPLRMISPGILRCKGDHIDIVREYFFPIVQHYQRIDESKPDMMPYFSWNDVEHEKMMSVTNFTQPFYIGQKKRFKCEASPFFYARGIHWIVVYQNETVNVKGNHTKNSHHTFGIYQDGNQASIELLSEPGLQQLICKAPVWNQTDWGTKTLTFNVTKPVAPTIDGALVEEQNWTVNDTNKVLNCTYKGIPAPSVNWRKNNKTIYKDIQKVNATPGAITSILKIPRVGLEAHDTYTCRVSNVAGSQTKTFSVYVVPAELATVVIILYVIAGMCIIIAIVGGVFGIRKMRDQKDKIRRLANVAFKDVTDRGNASGNGNVATNVIPTAPHLANSPHNPHFETNNGNGNRIIDTFGNNEIFNGTPNTNANPNSVGPELGKYQKM